MEIQIKSVGADNDSLYNIRHALDENRASFAIEIDIGTLQKKMECFNLKGFLQQDITWNDKCFFSNMIYKTELSSSKHLSHMHKLTLEINGTNNLEIYITK